jgi:peptidoglycan hydrolase-like protein with peptidoglycan-binding domain
VFGRRRSAGDRDRDLDGRAADEVTEAAETAAAEAQVQTVGPWDVTEPHPELPRVDLGSLQVPVLEGTDIQLVFAEQHGAWVTVRHQLSELQLQAFAAPKRSGLWDEVRAEIATELAGTGGQSGERTGPFGTELVAQVPAEQGQPASGVRPIRFVGVDGPRWFLRGLFAGAAAADPAAAAPLEAVFSQVVVVRGDHPMPPRDLLELKLPAEAAAALEEQTRAQQAEQEQNRFNTAPNPFERGPEMTETR